MSDLPQNLTPDDFDLWRKRPAHWHGPAASIAQEAGYSDVPLSAFSESSNLVIALGRDAILKIFPPFHRDQYLSESAALAYFDGQLSIETPKLLAKGEASKWTWVIMSRLEGEIGSSLWPSLMPQEKRLILHDVGRVMAETHALPSAPLCHIGPNWADFIAQQAKACLARHKSQELAAHLLPELESLAQKARDLIPLDGPNVPLMGDWIPQNFLLNQRDGVWRLSALIDFGDLRLGWHEYDFLAPSAMMCEGRADYLQSFFDGYFSGRPYDWPAHRKRLMALMILHFASDLRNLVLPESTLEAQSLKALAERIWPCSK